MADAPESMMARRVSPSPVVKLDPIGACIYCGRTDTPLEIEHIFPLALGGTYELPDASCRKCATLINSQIETPISDHDWGALREKTGMPTRGKSKRTHIKARRHDGGRIKIPIADYPAVAFHYNFGTARLLSRSGDEQKRDILILSTDPDGSHDAECKCKYPEWDGTYSTIAKPHTFARLLAKIAWGWVVSQAGSNWFRESITPIILGRVEDYTTHVGGDMDGYEWEGEVDRRPGFTVRPQGDGTALVVCDISFINDPTTPRYHVVIGETDFSIGDDQRTVTFGTGEVGPPPPCVSITRERDPTQQILMGPARPVVGASAQPAAILPGLPGNASPFTIEKIEHPAKRSSPAELPRNSPEPIVTERQMDEANQDAKGSGAGRS